MTEKPETLKDFEKLFDLTGAESTESKLAELAKTRDLFTVREAVGYADQKKKLELPTIGYHVNYYPLRVSDRMEIEAIVDSNPAVERDKRNRKKVQLILYRAYPEVTEKYVSDMAGNLVDVILIEYDGAEDNRFLRPLMRRRSAG